MPRLAYDGSDRPEVIETTLTNLHLDEDYEFTVTALNPLESEESSPIMSRAAGLPEAPGIITEIL